MRKTRWTRIASITFAALAFEGAATSAALANETQYYCQPCQERQGETYYGPYHGPSGDNKYILGSYVHYLGSGTRHLRAGMWVQQDGSYRFASGTNEVAWWNSVGYGGQAYSKQDPNYPYYNYVTVNANNTIFQR